LSLLSEQREGRKAQAPAEPEMWIMVKRKLTVGGLIGHLASVLHFHNKIKIYENTQIRVST